MSSHQKFHTVMNMVTRVEGLVHSPPEASGGRRMLEYRRNAWLSMALFSLVLLCFCGETVLGVDADQSRTTHAMEHLQRAVVDRKRQRAESQHLHECVFAIRTKNREFMEKLLLEVSNPMSDKYGQYLSREEVGELTANLAAVGATEQYMSAFPEAELVSKTLYGEYLKYRAPVRVWEQVFATEFYHMDAAHFKPRPSTRRGRRPGNNDDERITRALHYTVPEVLTDHVETVFNTIQIPIYRLSASIQERSPSGHSSDNNIRTLLRDVDIMEDDSDITETTPALLKSYCKYYVQNWTACIDILAWLAETSFV
jgi:hypothetical protein